MKRLMIIIYLVSIAVTSLANDIANDSAVIYFYRIKSKAESKLAFEIFINGEKIGKISNDGRIKYKIYSVGEAEIYVRSEDCESARIYLNIQSHSEYYVRVNGITCFIKEFDNRKGKYDFNNPHNFKRSIAELQEDISNPLPFEEVQNTSIAESTNREKSMSTGGAEAEVEEDLSVGPGKYYALIIGINDYIDSDISSLDFCIRDADMFYEAITSRYTFEKENVVLLRNATKTGIVAALDYFARTVRPIDNFLIFYAGHGVWNTDSETGFWLPSDARKSSTLNWFRNSALRDYLREINSKHTLLITDACFGGSIFKSRAAFMDAPLAINKLHELPSRKAMTSGTLTEVPDQSAFLKYMIARLDDNTEKYLSSEQLFSSFRIAVINNSDVIPQFGEIKDVGDEGGDFIFILRE